MTAPRGFESWLAALQNQGVGLEFDKELAERLRVMATLKDNAVCLLSGPETLPYVTWLRDGMAMSSRLIIHLEPARRKFDALVQTQLDDDIRIASHYQEIAAFCADIAQHRFDVVVLDAGTDLSRVLSLLRSLLNDKALLIVMCHDRFAQDVIKNQSGEFFCARLSNAGDCWVLARKGRQHRTSRRAAGKRQRKAQRR